MARDTLPVALELMFGDEGNHLVGERFVSRGRTEGECDASC